jgi:LPS export ABC transporter protein LptC
VRRVLLGIAAGAVLLGALSVGWRWHAASPPPQRSPVPPAPRISIGLDDATLVLRHRGVRQAEIRAQHVTVSRDLRSARFTGITQATVYDRAGEALHVTAAEILLDRQTNDLRIRGPVVITSPRGYELTASDAQWHDARQQMVFPHGVQVRHGSQTLRAGRLVVDAGLTSFELSGGVDIVFRLEAAPP